MRLAISAIHFVLVNQCYFRFSFCVSKSNSGTEACYFRFSFCVSKSNSGTEACYFRFSFCVSKSNSGNKACYFRFSLLANRIVEMRLAISVFRFVLTNTNPIVKMGCRFVFCFVLANRKSNSANEIITSVFCVCNSQMQLWLHYSCTAFVQNE